MVSRMSRIPPYLKPGSRVGITCPAGAVTMEEMQPMLAQLQQWGFEVVLGRTVGNAYFRFAGTDDERLLDLQAMLDDASIDAILFGRGGYGTVRILDRIDFSSFVKKPKWLLGYSDITAFHSHVHTRLGIATIHGHMCAGYKPENADAASTQSIFEVLCGQVSHYHSDPHPLNCAGLGQGLLVGGNLALLSDLLGTPSDLDTRGKILFIEDIGEYRYNIDRMMWQLLRAGKLDALAGLLVGGFTDTQDNEIPFGWSEEEIVWEKVRNLGYPVCFGFPVGHQPRNVALKCGAPFFLQVTEAGAELWEMSGWQGI